jgi:predicted PolB exonuclease-like 3'-5' exonuclease
MTIELYDLETEDIEPTYLEPAELDAILQNERRYSLFYDIETTPADDETMYSFFDEGKVKLPDEPGKFDASKVKYGNTKDKDKRAAKLADEKRKHVQAVATYDDDCRAAIDAAWEKHVAESTLDACTSRVLAIGYGVCVKGKEPRLLLDIEAKGNSEAEMLLRFWRFAAHAKKRGKLTSFNGHFFDLPYLTSRSWTYPDIKPLKLLTKYNKYEDFCVDVAVEYRQGRYGTGGAIKLDKLAQHLGVRRKLEGVTGDMFHVLFKEDPERALEYLELDVLVLYDCARRMDLL